VLFVLPQLIAHYPQCQPRSLVVYTKPSGSVGMGKAMWGRINSLDKASSQMAATDLEVYAARAVSSWGTDEVMTVRLPEVRDTSARLDRR
jgi:hypothetical protein